MGTGGGGWVRLKRETAWPLGYESQPVCVQLDHFLPIMAHFDAPMAEQHSCSVHCSSPGVFQLAIPIPRSSLSNRERCTVLQCSEA